MMMMRGMQRVQAGVKRKGRGGQKGRKEGKAGKGGDDGGGGGGRGGGGGGGTTDGPDVKRKKRKKKKFASSEYYDITDPFIDDSELAIDERTWFAQTKQQGFYVSSRGRWRCSRIKEAWGPRRVTGIGEWACYALVLGGVMRIASRKKPRSKKAPVSAGPAPVPVVMGSEDETARLLDDTGIRVGWWGHGTWRTPNCRGRGCRRGGSEAETVYYCRRPGWQEAQDGGCGKGFPSSYMCAVLTETEFVSRGYST